MATRGFHTPPPAEVLAHPVACQSKEGVGPGSAYHTTLRAVLQDTDDAEPYRLFHAIGPRTAVAGCTSVYVCNDLEFNERYCQQARAFYEAYIVPRKGDFEVFHDWNMFVEQLIFGELHYPDAGRRAGLPRPRGAALPGGTTTSASATSGARSARASTGFGRWAACGPSTRICSTASPLASTWSGTWTTTSTTEPPRMPKKLKTLLASRRFWVAVAGVLVVVLQDIGLPVAEDHVQMIVLVLASWIVGDSLRSTGGAFPAAVLLMCVLGAPLMADDVHDVCRAATVRVRNGNSLGSGTVFRASDQYCYVLTNAHVAGTRLGTRVECEFWRVGHQSRPVAGETVVVAYVPRAYRDIAVVRVDRRLLGGYLPPVVPIARPDEQADYRRLFSVGCASGRWPTAFEGFALRRDAKGGDTVHFVPAPAGGRSGSALFDVRGDWPRIVGLVAWRSSDEGGHGLDGRGEKHGHGIAMTHQEVWAGLRGQRQGVALAAPSGAIPVQHTKQKPKSDEAKAPAKRSAPKQRDKPAAPLDTGSASDVILLYSDPVAIGPNPEPPAGCEDGRCFPPQNPSDSSLFPSLPNDLGNLGEKPRAMLSVREWLPWIIAIAAVGVLLGRPLLRLPTTAVDWFVKRVEQRLQPQDPAPPPRPRTRNHERPA